MRILRTGTAKDGSRVAEIEGDDGTKQTVKLNRTGTQNGAKVGEVVIGGKPMVASFAEPLAQEGGLKETVSRYAHTILPGVGAALGLVGGGGAGLATGPAAPAASPTLGVAGAALGYGIGERLATTGDELIGIRQPQPLKEEALKTVQDVGEGAAFEMGGQMIGPVVGGVAKGVVRAGRETLGAMTGAGPEAIRQAASGAPGFVKGLRGGVSSDDIVSGAKAALGEVKGRRTAAYAEKLATIPQTVKLSKRPVDQTVNTILKDFGIRAEVDDAGELVLDFSRSSVTDKTAQGNVAAMLQDVRQWGSQADDLTPMGMDLLKRRLQDYYTPLGANNANAISTRLSRSVKQTIVDSVPQYAALVKDYEKATNFITEAERALSLNDRAMMDTTLKKLLSTQRENMEFRKELLLRMEEQAGRSLSPEIAGATMNQWIPKGLVGKLSVGGAGTVAATGGLTPGIAAYLAVSSPRVAGEILHTLVGVPRREVGKILASREFQKFTGTVRAAQNAAKRGIPMTIARDNENGK